MKNIQTIVAKYLRSSSAEISRSTLINYKAVGSSIMLHRMYAALSDAGVIIDDPASIKTFGELLDAAHIRNPKKEHFGESLDDTRASLFTTDVKQIWKECNVSVGIDIEDISNIPSHVNYHSNAFFTENFSTEEILYCIQQPEPQASFAAKFSLKEAIVKADNSKMGLRFRDIVIGNNCLNAPVHLGFALSVSHSQSNVVAIAIKLVTPESEPTTASRCISEEEVIKIVIANNDEYKNKLRNTLNLLKLVFCFNIFSFIAYSLSLI